MEVYPKPQPCSSWRYPTWCSLQGPTPLSVLGQWAPAPKLQWACPLSFRWHPLSALYEPAYPIAKSSNPCIISVLSLTITKGISIDSSQDGLYFYMYTLAIRYMVQKL